MTGVLPISRKKKMKTPCIFTVPIFVFQTVCMTIEILITYLDNI